MGLPESSLKTACQPFFCTAHCRVSHITLQWAATFSPQILPLPVGGSVPHLTHLGPTRVVNPNGISIGSAVFVWVPNAMLYNALSVGKKNPKIALPLGILSPRRRRTEPRPLAACIKNYFGIHVRGQTDRQTDTHRDVLVTILRHRSRGQSNKYSSRHCAAPV